MDILKNRISYLLVSWVLFLLSILFIFVFKLNLGIDMTWWTQAEYSFTKSFDIDAIRENLSDLATEITYNDNEIINDVTVYTVSWENVLVVISWFDSSIEEKF